MKFLIKKIRCAWNFPKKNPWCFTTNSRGDVFVHRCEHPLRLLADGFAGQSSRPDLCASDGRASACLHHAGAGCWRDDSANYIYTWYILIYYKWYIWCILYIYTCIMVCINGIITNQWGYTWDKLGYNIMWDSRNKTSHILLKWSSFQWPKGTRISRYFSGIHLGAIANNHRCAGQGDIVTSLDEYLKNERNSKI